MYLLFNTWHHNCTSMVVMSFALTYVRQYFNCYN